MKKILLIIPTLALFGGCSASVPKCSDTEVTEIVKELANEQMTSQLGSKAAEIFTYAVNAIRTTNENSSTGAFECAAQLEIIADEGGISKEIPITYTVEKTDTGEEFYVNVSGL